MIFIYKSAWKINPSRSYSGQIFRTDYQPLSRVSAALLPMVTHLPIKAPVPILASNEEVNRGWNSLFLHIARSLWMWLRLPAVIVNVTNCSSASRGSDGLTINPSLPSNHANSLGCSPLSMAADRNSAASLAVAGRACTGCLYRMCRWTSCLSDRCHRN